MEVKYDVKIPQTANTCSEEYDILLDFIQSNHKTMSIKYNTVNIAKSKISSIKIYIKRHEINTIKVKRIDTILYFAKDDNHL